MGRVGGAALLISLLLDWYTAEGGLRQFNAWEAFPKLDYLLALAAFIALVGPAHARWGHQLQLLAGGFAVLTVLAKWVNPPAYSAISVQVGLFIALAAGLAVVVAAVACLRDGGGSSLVRAVRAEPALEPGGDGRRPAPRLLSLETAVAFMLLLAVAWGTYGTYVGDAGIDTVGWAHAAAYRNAEDPGFLGIGAFAHLNYRPLAKPYLGTIHSTFGLEMWMHAAWAIALALAMSLLTFRVLRVLGMASVGALVVAVLVLVFPAASTARLGTTHSIASFSVVLYLIGLLLAFAGFRREGRAALPWHAAGSAMFLITLLAYEITLGAIVAGVGVYFIYRRSWRAAIRRWVWDLGVVGLAVALVTLRDTPRNVLPLDEQLEHARLIVEQAIDLLAAAMVPLDQPPIPGVAATVLAVLLAAMVTAVWLPRGHSIRRTLTCWVGIWGAGAIVVAAGYLPFVATDLYYSPLKGAEANRINTLPAVGFALLVVATAQLLGTLAFAALAGVRTGATAAVMVLAVLVFGGYLAWLEPHKRVAIQASMQQREIVEMLEKRLPPQPDGTTLLLFGSQRYVTEGAGATRAGWVVFGESWDLAAALRLAQENPTLQGYAVERSEISCGPDGAFPTLYGPEHSTTYRDGLVAFDAVTKRVVRLTIRDECVAATSSMREGGYLGPGLTPG